MNSSIVQKNISALCGIANWRTGMLMFKDNAVLDIKLDANTIEAKVIHDIAKVERIRLTYSETHVACKCSCSGTRGFCAHAVAVLLEADQRFPGEAKFLYSDDHVPQAVSWSAITDMIVSQNEETEKIKNAPQETTEPPKESPGRKTASLQKLLKSKIQAKLNFAINLNDLPDLESRWGQIPIGVNIAFHGRDYSGTNLKRVINGNASGNMTMEDFSVREQQLIRFLTFNIAEEKNGFLMGAYDFADFLHFLADYDKISLGNNRVITPHKEPVQAIITVREKEDQYVITPTLTLENGIVLSNENNHFITGKGGYWIGNQDNYWWLPGCFNPAWLRTFIAGIPCEIDAEEYDTLQQLIREGSLPAKLVHEETTELTSIKTIMIRPSVLLHWKNRKITLQLQFLYDSVLVTHWSPHILNIPGKGLVCRDFAREAHFVDFLTNAGFTPEEGTPNLFNIDDPQKILQFIEQTLPDLEKKRWQIYFTRQFRKNQHNSGKVILETSPDAEGKDWFSITYRLVINQRTTISWPTLMEAIESHRYTFFNPVNNESVIKIEPGLATIAKIIHYRISELTETTMRFGIFAAVPIFQAIGKRRKETLTRWERLANTIINTEAIPPLQFNSRLFTPRQYQLDGVAWLNLLAQCGFHGILADEMGLGKTLQTLMLLSLYRDKQYGSPSLIICPTSLMINWQKEAARFFPEMRVLVITSSMKDNLSMMVMDYDLIITSYNLLRLDSEAYSSIVWNYMVLDEAQNIKNHRTANAISCKSILSKYRLILSGTPLENSLTELWSLFDFLLPGFLGNADGFKKMYLNPDRKEEAMAQLAALIKPFVLRRLKSDVCRQLPPKIEKIIYCEMSKGQRSLYEKIRHLALEKLADIEQNNGQGNRLELLTMLLRMRQVCCDPRLLPDEVTTELSTALPDSVKVQETLSLLEDAIATGHRILLFSQFTSMLALLKEEIEKKGWAYEYLDGNTRDRQNRVDHFNKDESIPLFLLSLKAGGTGLNLAGADTVVHFDQWWNPMVEEQATDRSHRIGQHRTVTSIKMVIRNSVEERILSMQESKKALFQQIFQSGAIGKGDELTLADIAFMLEDSE